MDRFTSLALVHLITQNNMRSWLEISLIALVLTYTHDGKFLGWLGDAGALQTNLFHPTKCDVLSPNKIFHSFPNMELECNVALNESCYTDISIIIRVLLSNCMTCNKRIFREYIWRQLIDMKYFYEMQDLLAFFETKKINLELFSFYKWITH
jgi:hypothetical protein